MRFIELFVAITAVIAFANAAPTGNRDVNVQNVPAVDTHKMIFDPKTMTRQSSRRQQQQNKHQKRHKPCCDASLDLNLGARLGIGASAGGPAVDPAPVVAAQPPPAPAVPVNRNDRVGDSVVVIVDADHS